MSADRRSELGTADRRNRKLDLDTIAPSCPDASCDPSSEGSVLTTFNGRGQLAGKVRVIMAGDLADPRLAGKEAEPRRAAAGVSGWPELRLWPAGLFTG